jgi:membrane fusion protein (multidrug efflux system)
MRRWNKPIVLSLVLLLAGCGKQEDAAPPGGGMPPPAAVTVETVTAQTVPISFEYVGRLEASREIEIRPRIAGVIQKRHFEEGAPVKAGDLLYTLDTAALVAQTRAAEAEYVNRQAQAKEARQELERNQALAAQNFVSQRAVDATQTTLAVTEAAARAAQANLTNARIGQSYATLRAPISGVMSRALQVEGALVSPTGPALTTLAQINPVFARFSIGEEERLALEKQVADGALQTGQQKVSLELADGSRPSVLGKLNFSDYKANPETGAFDMRAEFPNADGALKPGQFVRVIVEGGTLTDAVTVPQAAVLDGAQGKFVYVASHAQAQPGQPAPPPGMTVALPRPVVVGAWVGNGAKPEDAAAGKDAKGRWVIQSGLQPGDKVIVEGTARIFFPGMPVAVAEAGANPVSPPAAAPPAAKQ